MSISTTAYAVVTKTVKPSGRTGHIYLDRTWIGKEVMILLKEPPEEPIAETTKTSHSETTDRKEGLAEVLEKKPMTDGLKMVGKRID